MINKVLFLLLFLFASCNANKQQNLVLYYYTNADSTLLGVKTAHGKEIIPLHQPNFGFREIDSPITSRILDFYGLPINITFQSDTIHPASAGTTVYDRNGNLLYFPFWFDNGSDFIVEGARRNVDIKSKKMGLVHPLGKVLIPARYDYITTLQKGYVLAYDGVRRKYEAGGEHWYIVADSTKIYRRYVVNRYGEVVLELAADEQDADIESLIHLKKLPEIYKSKNAKEERLIKRLNKDSQLDRYLKKYAHQADEKVDMHILERPTARFPYFVVTDGLQYIAIDGMDNLYFFDYIEPPIPLEKYMEKIEQIYR